MAPAEQLRPGAGPPVIPMKATAGELPGGPGWRYEVKWDGMRVVATVTGDRVTLTSATGRDITTRFPELAPLAGHLAGHQVVLDGEVVALNDRGRPDFGVLQSRLHVGDPTEAARRAAEVPVTYQVFDLLHLDGHDLVDLPTAERRRLLAELVEPGTHWQVPPDYDDGAALLRAAEEMGMEGVVAKRADSPYRPGTRTTAWRKVKVRRRQELVVGGWTEGTGRRAHHLGALLVGYYDGGALRFAGRVGSGLTAADLAWWRQRLAETATDQCPFDPPPPAADRRVAHWAQPTEVVEVAFAEWSHDGRLRHPTYQGRRTDKAPPEVTREE